MPITHKHRATEPTPVVARPDAGRGTHRASRTSETVITLTLAALVIALAVYMALRG